MAETQIRAPRKDRSGMWVMVVIFGGLFLIVALAKLNDAMNPSPATSAAPAGSLTHWVPPGRRFTAPSRQRGAPLPQPSQNGVPSATLEPRRARSLDTPETFSAPTQSFNDSRSVLQPREHTRCEQLRACGEVLHETLIERFEFAPRNHLAQRGTVIIVKLDCTHREERREPNQYPIRERPGYRTAS